VHVNKDELAALVVRGHLPEEARGDGMAIRKTIEGVFSPKLLRVVEPASDRRIRRNASPVGDELHGITRHCRRNGYACATDTRRRGAAAVASETLH
jgi:hypothetical protein